MPQPLVFNDEGLFKIVQFTDLHWGDGNENDMKTRRVMERVLEEERPDLVVITGDVIESGTCTTPAHSIREAAASLVKAGTPWAVVFGNHDAEGNATHAELIDAIRDLPHGLTESGPEELTGTGNYVLRVAGRDGKTDQALFFLDSGAYADAPIGGYAAFARDQIDWFVRESEALAVKNGGKPVPALAFFHIPLPEYNDVWDFRECRGHKYEEICCPLLNTGMFAAMVQQGNVAGTFVGHDHANDFAGELMGVTLCYGRKTGYNNYSKEGFAHGARVIVLEEGVRGFRSWLRLETGEVIGEQPLHRPEGRPAGR
ncbi:metallophosphoesterase family protein [Cohnella candidum]|uniref:Metallophosphoesterase n=1 Tax=Cohnella candidum TaxID=2674991 RepID=A0A3G3JXH6_9BACL|nr:metallophosphoesterase family protein [Cohnella candidum]AYQ72925.1 metallophosphoesterase [Cohnella candidum]